MVGEKLEVDLVAVRVFGVVAVREERADQSLRALRPAYRGLKPIGACGVECHDGVDFAAEKRRLGCSEVVGVVEVVFDAAGPVPHLGKRSLRVIYRAGQKRSAQDPPPRIRDVDDPGIRIGPAAVGLIEVLLKDDRVEEDSPGGVVDSVRRIRQGQNCGNGREDAEHRSLLVLHYTK